MGVERTLAIIKPDAVEKNAAGAILKAIQDAGLRVIGLKMLHLSEQQARGFYAVHKARPFYADLVKFMTSGPVVVVALEGENAIAHWRELMGPTDSTKAAKGTIRGDWGTDVERNAAHGSDAPETARVEIAYWFNATEMQAPVEALP
ncbi:MAG: nucleoside-diphosphate kinase [Myxococcota bacterium]|jgi:nucleoside-diphosphate kinase|nr:nucleoside-diphosphate kinase [Myxococcota bacterium]